MFSKSFVFIFILYLGIVIAIAEDSFEYCEKSVKDGKYNKECGFRQSHLSRKRYILYDVNPPEGFNLRRDVYVRIASFTRHIAKEDAQYKWNLVLPPWGNLYHWKSNNIGSQKQIPWGTFFDIDSLKKYAPVMEMYDFIKEYSVENEGTILDCVYVLRNDEEMFRTGHFKDKNIITDCPKTRILYKKQSNEQFIGSFWSYKNITSREVKCLTFHGTTRDLKKNLQPDLHRTVMFDHMEIPLHYAYGSADYWQARRSMRYNLELYEIANEFRLIYLNSNNLDDNTPRTQDWTLEEKKRNAIGGPYLAVHFRRQDFVVGRTASSPSVQNAASQIKKNLKFLNLDVVFIATDADETEYFDLKNELRDYDVFRFVPTKSIKDKFKDGGIAIIDQIICSYARYFIGTHESTFTFRIQEDREILGFPANTTFNRLCGNEKKCSAGGRWEIVWN